MLDTSSVPTQLSIMPNTIGGAAITGCTSTTLSWRLRSETRADHDAVERCTGWPSSIKDLDDYRACLRGLLSIWQAFEMALAARCDWDLFSIGQRRRSRLPALMRDLRLLGNDPDDVLAAPVVPPQKLPGMIGAVYVLEGSALGGRVILVDLMRRLGPALGEATTFFAAEGDVEGPTWRDLILAVDGFGTARPEARDAVVGGARQTFHAFIQAFTKAPATATAAFPSAGALS